MSKDKAITEQQDQDIYKILKRYQDQKPIGGEKCYPVSAVLKAMLEYAELKDNQ